MENTLFEQLYRRYYRPLFLYACSLTGNREDAEDLTAGTFVKVLTSFEGGSITSWMYRVLRNDYLDLRKKQRWEAPLDETVLQAAPAPDDVLEQYIQNEELRRLYREIQNLPEPEREVMLLTVQTDISDTAISEILGLTPNHVRVLRYRARRQLISKEDTP